MSDAVVAAVVRRVVLGSSQFASSFRGRPLGTAASNVFRRRRVAAEKSRTTAAGLKQCFTRRGVFRPTGRASGRSGRSSTSTLSACPMVSSPLSALSTSTVEPTDTTSSTCSLVCKEVARLKSRGACLVGQYFSDCKSRGTALCSRRRGGKSGDHPDYPNDPNRSDSLKSDALLLSPSICAHFTVREYGSPHLAGMSAPVPSSTVLPRSPPVSSPFAAQRFSSLQPVPCRYRSQRGGPRCSTEAV